MALVHKCERKVLSFGALKTEIPVDLLIPLRIEIKKRVETWLNLIEIPDTNTSFSTDLLIQYHSCSGKKSRMHTNVMNTS